MAFDLEGKSGPFRTRMTSSGWPQLLAIAEDYGWKPAGTNPPKGMKRASWDGGYHTNDGQLVTAQDAQALATAIDNALKDDCRRVRTDGKRANKDATESQRQQALEKLSAIAKGMTVEYVKSGDKSPSKSKRKKESDGATPAGSLEELVASKGLSMEELAGLVATLKSPPAGTQARDPWFNTEDGRELLRDLAAFCRKGEFRIF